MANQGYFIISPEQYAIVSALGYDVETIGGFYCVTNWYDIQEAIIASYDATWEDEIDGNEVDQSQYDIIEASVQYMYYSSESHTWTPA